MQNWSPQLNWKASTLFMATDPDWKRKIFVGGLVLLIPIIGWPAILGYRKVVVERLVDGALPLLPEWRGNCMLDLSLRRPVSTADIRTGHRSDHLTIIVL